MCLINLSGKFYNHDVQFTYRKIYEVYFYFKLIRKIRLYPECEGPYISVVPENFIQSAVKDNVNPIIPSH